MNNDILIGSLKKHFGIEAEASGRNDLIVQDNKKISGSAYKLKLGNKQGEGRKSLHHGTMLLHLEMDALKKYLNPSKAKLESKGVESVVSRVINLQQLNPDINHDTFCKALQSEFINKWADSNTVVNNKVLRTNDLLKIPKLREIFQKSEDWEWRFGQTPDFKNSLEKKFSWALVDFQFTAVKGVITEGRCFSDCLVPPFIDAINDILSSGQITYDVVGIKNMCT